jgi:2,3-bisphosphoglycerate-dependent phosphoglycerate mutase
MQRNFKYVVLICILSSCYNTFYVVRHAEKQLQPANNPNPALTEEGQQRARDLNTYLGKRKPDSIFVSTFLRTQQTAAPTAEASGVTPIIINQTDTNAINQFVKRMIFIHKKKVLIVGHTTTVPRIVKGLSGVRINAINEDDYDNIYIIKVRRSGRTLISTTYGVVSPQ